MAKVAPYHSTSPEDAETFHDDDECPVGRPENRAGEPCVRDRSWTGFVRLVRESRNQHSPGNLGLKRQREGLRNAAAARVKRRG